MKFTLVGANWKACEYSDINHTKALNLCMDGEWLSKFVLAPLKAGYQ